ncbi:Dethiobiotin synthetase [Microcoleus sp. FACHB-672]|uniref:Dethiobiotin synthetase n=1 Tax=Microcoleus sp. FACHB-672 TaxID=2692825 RepID=UPI001689147E|nr:Dethiobiotin synthetase [Microcoleus sp. FACHB-672]MBD2043298.1 Dethiobiotin synthetase [Microcoleus sp. FACHB-672]
MDYKTARNFILSQGTALTTQKNPDAFLMLLKEGKPPVPGQMTSILLAVKIIGDALHENPDLDRQLVVALYSIAVESIQLFEAGYRAGVEWPPLLKEDLDRLALAVKNTFAGIPQGKDALDL